MVKNNVVALTHQYLFDTRLMIGYRIEKAEIGGEATLVVSFDGNTTEYNTIHFKRYESIPVCVLKTAVVALNNRRRAEGKKQYDVSRCIERASDLSEAR